MSSPDIKDYINNLDNNKDNNDHIVDEKEVQLLNTTLGTAEDNLDLVNVLNEKSELKKLTKFIVNGIENQKDSTSLGYYTEFVQKFQNYMSGLPDKDMSLINDLTNAITNQHEKIARNTNPIQEKENNIQGNKQLDKADNKGKIQHENKTNDIVSGNTTDLKNLLDSLQSNEISQFKGVIDSLNNGSLSSEKMPQFASMMNILRQMNGLSKDQIISVVDITIDTKFADKKDSPEMKLFKDTLSAVLEKGLIGKFITIVDEDLNKNDTLKGLSYDVLLDSKTDLSSKEARVGINNIFSRDESLFNKLVTELQSDKKGQVENIIKEYIKSDFPNQDLSGTTIEIGEVQLQDIEGKSYTKKCFNVMKDGKILEVSSGKDENGKDKLQKLTPFFGDAKYGKIIPMEQCLTSNLMKDVLGKDNLAMPGVANVMKELITVNGKNMSFSDAISSLFESPLFLEIKQAFLALLSMMGDDPDKQSKFAIEANFAQAERDLSKITETVEDKNGNKISYLKALKALNLENKDIKDGINPMQLFANAPLENQKKYIAEVIKKPGTRYEQLNILGDITKTSTPEKQKDDSKTETIDQKNTAQEFISGKEYKGLSLDGIKPGKVEKKGEGDNQYLTVDGQPISLPGSLFVKGSDGKIIEKTISIAQDEATKKQTLSIAEKSIENSNNLEQIKKVFDVNKLVYPPTGLLSKGIEDLFRYYALESSGDTKNSNPIDALLKLDPRNDDIEKAIVEMKKELTTNTSNTKESLQKIFNKGKIAIDAVISRLTDPQKKNTQSALNQWSTAVSINTTPKKA